jgi:aspartate/methionine/tyrosine aminotransferase
MISGGFRPQIHETEAVDVLAKEFEILLMHGSPFGADGYLRLSYGSIPEHEIVNAVDRLGRGLKHLQTLSLERSCSPLIEK